MTTRYLIRLDDACPTMNHQNWDRIESLLDKYGVKPMVGVIPHNKDTSQILDSEDPNFWIKVKAWERKGWTIAMHGYNHVYSSKEGGINPFWKRSEFAGHPLELQQDKIRKGVAVMRKQGINPRFFFAPSHTFDENTLEALREESDIRIISDTIGRYPYIYNGFYFIPQIIGHCVKMPFPGIYTFCLHPNTMDEESYVRLDSFLAENQNSVIGFNEVELEEYSKKKCIDHLFSRLFFAYRYIRGLR